MTTLFRNILRKFECFCGVIRFDLNHRITLSQIIPCCRSKRHTFFSVQRYLFHVTAGITGYSIARPSDSPLLLWRLYCTKKSDMAEQRYCVDYAKQGRAGCKKCKDKIVKGLVRIGKVMPNPFSESGGEMKEWYHVKCIFEKLERARATTKKIEDITDLEGWEQLQDAEKEMINEHITEFAAKPSGTPKKKTVQSTLTASGQVTSPKKQQTASPSPHKFSGFKAKPKVSDDAPSTSNSEMSAQLCDPHHKDCSLREFRKLCGMVADKPSYNVKTQIFHDFLTKGSAGGTTSPSHDNHEEVDISVESFQSPHSTAPAEEGLPAMSPSSPSSVPSVPAESESVPGEGPSGIGHPVPQEMRERFNHRRSQYRRRRNASDRFIHALSASRQIWRQTLTADMMRRRQMSAVIRGITATNVELRGIRSDLSHFDAHVTGAIDRLTAAVEHAAESLHTTAMMHTTPEGATVPVGGDQPLMSVARRGSVRRGRSRSADRVMRATVPSSQRMSPSNVRSSAESATSDGLTPSTSNHVRARARRVGRPKGKHFRHRVTRK